MTAQINGIQFTGTASELAELVKAMSPAIDPKAERKARKVERKAEFEAVAVALTPQEQARAKAFWDERTTPRGLSPWAMRAAAQSGKAKPELKAFLATVA